jgi:hypothetical protein
MLCPGLCRRRGQPAGPRGGDSPGQAEHRGAGLQGRQDDTTSTRPTGGAAGSAVRDKKGSRAGRWRRPGRRGPLIGLGDRAAGGGRRRTGARCTGARLAAPTGRALRVTGAGRGKRRLDGRLRRGRGLVIAGNGRRGLTLLPGGPPAARAWLPPGRRRHAPGVAPSERWPPDPPRGDGLRLSPPSGPRGVRQNSTYPQDKQHTAVHFWRNGPFHRPPLTVQGYQFSV